MTRIIITRKTNFNFESGIDVEESATSKIISGTLLKEGVSRNGRWYTVDEMLNIAQQAVGTPIYYGVDAQNRHKKGSAIGKIVRAKFDKVAKTIRFWAKIFNAKIAESVKKGWKVSIGGKADGQYLLSNVGRVILKLKNMILTHVQLFEPHFEEGVKGAIVENVEESMSFSNDLKGRELAVLLVTALKRGKKNE